MGESEREGKRESERACDGEDGENSEATRKRRKESSFIVESKMFEIVFNERRGKPPVSHRGEEERGLVMGPIRIRKFRAFHGGPNPLHKGRKRREMGKGMERQGEIRGQKGMGDYAGENPSNGRIDWQKSKHAGSKGRGKICTGEIKLEHCIVASWKSKTKGEEDLERLGRLWANSWGLKGNLGLAKLEKGRALLEFEDLKEARRVVSSGSKVLGGLQLGLEHWNPRTGCWAEEETENEV
ncbi:hypothetical protein CK203_100985 [Vitis vinifera]|uniref:DUF4283 domain-containing protein n=1 Tax=Vitis vinifera TaxID=29760 RepID=A0A438DFW6_VITVI|nr:hypothetical protein CK203_100985 [Vitis vinifera]